MITKYVLATIILFLMAVAANGQHWQSSDGPVPLLIDSNFVRIKLVGEHTDQKLETLIGNVEKLVGIATDIKQFEGFVVCSLSTKDDYDLTIETISATDGVYMTEPFYRKENGQPHMFGESFCVLFADEFFETEAEELAFDHGVELDRQIGNRTWVFRNRPESGRNIIDISNFFHDLNGVQAALPDFDVRIKLDSYDLYDYYNASQYNIKKVIGEFNGHSVWDFGGFDDTVYVAILDDGLTSHEDLPADRILDGYDFFNYDPDPTPGPRKAHGMAVAGLIGASHTTDSTAGSLPSSGIISMNPIVKFIPIKIMADVSTSDTISHTNLTLAMHDAFYNFFGSEVVEADIVVNCWNFDEDSAYHPPIDPLDTAIYYGSKDGRNLHGTPGVPHGTAVFWSAGNSNQRVGYPARHSSAFAVGAIDTFDVKQSYSNYGDELELVTYSAHDLSPNIWTLDQMDTLGYNPGVSYPGPAYKRTIWECGYEGENDTNYNCSFGGTSAAAPVVAGVATLLLARNDTLSANTIYDILKYSAVTELESGTITPPDTLYGWGRVDAFRAMLSITRGDMNANGKINLADITYLIAYVNLGGADPFPDYRLGNCDCDPAGAIDSLDIDKLIDHVYISKDPLPLPCFVY